MMPDVFPIEQTNRTHRKAQLKEPLVLLPGMMCDARLWREQISEFSSERAIFASPLIGADTIAELTKLILDEAPQEFALAGLSMGGICAMEMIRQAPERVSRLALLDTNALPDPTHLASVREAQMRRAMTEGVRTVMREEMKPNYLADGPKKAEILHLCMQMAEALGPEVLVAQSRALMTRPDQRETLRHVSVPTLILCGAKDRLCPLDRHTLMRDLVPGACLEVVDGAGHLPTLERPLETNAALQRWLEQ